MLRLDGAVRRHRRIVIAAWVVVLAAALPFAAKQSDNLSGGGFGVPGSQSKNVADALERDFSKAEQSQLAAVLVPERGAEAGQVRAALDRVAAAVKAEDDVALASAARERAASQAGTGRPVI